MAKAVRMVVNRFVAIFDMGGLKVTTRLLVAAGEAPAPPRATPAPAGPIPWSLSLVFDALLTGAAAAVIIATGFGFDGLFSLPGLKAVGLACFAQVVRYLMIARRLKWAE